MTPQEFMEVVRGERPADLLLVNGRLINVYAGEVIEADLALADGRIAGWGRRPANDVLDLHGAYVAPGLIDPHVHIESAMTTPGGFARAILPHGTTAVVADPHEIANVLGVRGIDYMLQASAALPVQFFFSLPSCVPATHLETSGAALGADDLAPYMTHPRIRALGEMMNFPGAVQADPAVTAKIALARQAGKPVDGHAPGLSGLPLQAYRAAGIGSDHECTRLAEAHEKLRLGLHIMIREGTGAKNLNDLLALVTPANAHRIMWCTDDRHPHELRQEGHIDGMLRSAVQRGLDPLLAIRLATLNPARYFGLEAMGAIAPGKRADLAVFQDLREFDVVYVFCAGRLVARRGRLSDDILWPAPPAAPSSFALDARRVDLRIAALGREARVIEIVPGQILTRQQVIPMKIRDGCALADPARDLLKLAVIERHRGTGRTGCGFVRGLGLKRGALASSVAHDAHNVIVAGADDRAMQTALARVCAMGGGMAVAEGDRVLADLPLPIAGLMSEAPLADLARADAALREAARQLGAALPDPFMTLSFMALPVIPELKLTDRGLVDVTRFEIVPLFTSVAA